MKIFTENIFGSKAIFKPDTLSKVLCYCSACYVIGLKTLSFASPDHSGFAFSF